MGAISPDLSGGILPGVGCDIDQSLGFREI